MRRSEEVVPCSLLPVPTLLTLDCWNYWPVGRDVCLSSWPPVVRFVVRTLRRRTNKVRAMSCQHSNLLTSVCLNIGPSQTGRLSTGSCRPDCSPPVAWEDVKASRLLTAGPAGEQKLQVPRLDIVHCLHWSASLSKQGWEIVNLR